MEIQLEAASCSLPPLDHHGAALLCFSRQPIGDPTPAGLSLCPTPPKARTAPGAPGGALAARGEQRLTLPAGTHGSGRSEPRRRPAARAARLRGRAQGLKAFN